MRSISKDAYNAFIDRKPFKKTNTEVLIDENGDASLYLFGNEIVKSEGNNILINYQGFTTVTTKERLSPFIDIRLQSHKFYIKYPFLPYLVEWKKKGWLNITEPELDV